MEFVPQDIPDVIVIKPEVFGDERGFFMETFRQSEFENFGINGQFVQDNHSASTQGILRGLHYQINKPQGKLVRVIRGKVFDVAVDLRSSSASFGKYVGAILSETNRHMMWVPPGFAHGFYVMSESAEFVYKCTDYYSPEYERSLLWNDPEIGIDWPLEDISPTLSLKDQQAAKLAVAEVYP